MNRRRYLALTTASAAGIGLSGCVGDEADEETTSDDADETEADEEDEEETEVTEETPTDSELLGTFDEFDDIDLWEPFQDIGSIESDSDRALVGDQSALIEPNSDGQARIRRALDEPIDISEVVPGLAVTSDDRNIVQMQLQDEDGDYLEFSQQSLPDMPLTRHNFGLTRVRGDPDLSEIVVIQIICWYGDDDDGELWVDDLYFAPNTETGRVMLGFHGGYESHHEEALEILEEYDLPATAFVPTDRLRSDVAVQGDRMTYDQVEDLSDAGWTIASQSALGTPLPDLTGSELESSVTDPIDWLTDRGYEEGAQFMAYPANDYDEESYELVSENYELAFAGRSQSQGYAANPHLCSVVSPDADEAVDVVEWTADRGGVTSVAFYQMEESETIEAVAEMAETLDSLAEDGDLEVIMPADIADNYVYTED